MYIQSMKIEHIKAFDDLSLDFARDISSKYEGINVFVGGNSSGKSTLLKCMAMALSGPTVANQLLISPAGWIRRENSKGQIELKVQNTTGQDRFATKGAPPNQEGFMCGLQIESDLSTQSVTLKTREYRTPNGSRVQTAARGPWNPEGSGWFLAAYGPLRRLTGSSTEALRYALGGGKLASCVTLFREDAALSESETWIKQEYARSLQQKSEGQPGSSLVDNVVEFLNDGLLPTGFMITNVSVDHVFITTPNGGTLPMRDLSDGCRSAFALMLDIIHNMALAFHDTNIFVRNSSNKFVINRPGVILIDEVEAHLHPSWQRLICEWFRTRFPHIQFFVTTHSPLIAQAADPGGLYVLPLPNEISEGKSIRRLEPHEQERISLGRAEKVLLGEAFGLSETWSPRADRIVKDWEALAAKRQGNGGLIGTDLAQFEELTKQVSIVFDYDNEEVVHA